MGHLGQMPPPPPPPLLPPHLMDWRAILLIKILNFMPGKGQLTYKTHKNMHILLAFITNSPEPKVNQSQTSREIVTQHLHAY